MVKGLYLLQRSKGWAPLKKVSPQNEALPSGCPDLSTFYVEQADYADVGKVHRSTGLFEASAFRINMDAYRYVKPPVDEFCIGLNLTKSAAAKWDTGLGWNETKLANYGSFVFTPSGVSDGWQVEAEHELILMTLSDKAT